MQDRTVVIGEEPTAGLQLVRMLLITSAKQNECMRPSRELYRCQREARVGEWIPWDGMTTRRFEWLIEGGVRYHDRRRSMDHTCFEDNHWRRLMRRSKTKQQGTTLAVVSNRAWQVARL